MSRNTVIGLVVLVVVLLGGWYFIQQSQRGQVIPTPAPQVRPQEETATPGAQSVETVEENVVTVSSSGFSPQNITIAAGESVTWANEDGNSHQVNSAVHPTHQLYPPLNTVGLLRPGERKSLNFPAAGTYRYHDHLNPSSTGSVTVQ